MKSLTFNGIKKDWLYLLQGRTKPPFASIRRNLLTVSGMPGAHLQSSDVQPLPINQPIGFKVEDDEHALQLKDELAEWLATDEPVELEFDDEPGRTYYAIVQNTLDDFEKMVSLRQGTIQFLCLDPYGYGPELTAAFPSDNVTLTNNGTAEADPVFEMEVLAPITFAMIQNQNDEYQMLGVPVDEDGNEQMVDTKTSVLKEDGSTIDTWSSANPDMVDSNFIDLGGGMGADGSGVRPTDFGTGDKMHGPAVSKELPNAIQDFEIETTFDIHSTRTIENWRMEIYFHDENMNMLGKLGVKDNNRNHLRRHGLGRVGHYRGSDPGYVIGSTNYLYDDSRQLTLMYLRVRREGQRYTFYIAQWLNLRHTRTLAATYNDVSNQFRGRLKYITLFIGKYQDRPTPSRLRINSVEVFELKRITEDQTPYIAYPGDLITFDHVNDDIFVNGESIFGEGSRPIEKDFGGDFFKLHKGDNQLIVAPSGSLATQVRYKERYR